MAVMSYEQQRRSLVHHQQIEHDCSSGRRFFGSRSLRSLSRWCATLWCRSVSNVWSGLYGEESTRYSCERVRHETVVSSGNFKFACEEATLQYYNAISHAVCSFTKAARRVCCSSLSQLISYSCHSHSVTV